MKKIILLVILFSILLFTSCASERNHLNQTAEILKKPFTAEITYSENDFTCRLHLSVESTEGNDTYRKSHIQFLSPESLKGLIVSFGESSAKAEAEGVVIELSKTETDGFYRIVNLLRPCEILTWKQENDTISLQTTDGRTLYISASAGTIFKITDGKIMCDIVWMEETR